MKVPVEFNALAELPAGWSWQPLQSLTANPKQDVVDGPFGSNLKASEYVSAGVPIARLQNIDRNTFVTKNIRFLTPEKAADLARHEFRPDDILITKLGDPLGKACIAPASIGRGVIVADLVRVRPDEALVDRKYLTYAINSPALVKQFELHTKGTTRPRVNLSVLRQLPIPLAPREQQSEIVAEIEKQFSRLDEAVANLQRVKVNLKRYEAAVLKAAVEGRLVEIEAELARREGRNYEAGEKLLQRILEARRSQWEGRKKYKDPVAPVRADLSALPKGWVWTNGGQLFQWSSGVNLPVKNLSGGDVPVYGGNGVNGWHTESNISCPTLVIGRVGAGCGNVHLVARTAWITDNAIYATGTPCDCSLAYIGLVLTVANLNSVAAGSGQPFVNQTILNETMIALPPVGEQMRIVAEVDRHLSIVREVEAEVDANLKRTQALRQAVLSRSFST